MGLRQGLALALLLALAACGTIRPIAFSDAVETAPETVWPRPDDPYLARLRAQYGLDQVIAGASTDEERVRRLTDWTHRRWRHSSTHQATQHDPISILEAAGAGEQFRCVEYAIVLAGALSAVGLPARDVYLESDSALKNLLGISHAATEVWLRDRQRWVYADAQFNVVPMVAGRPVNAAELQRAIGEGAAVAAASDYAVAANVDYAQWIGPYLSYLTVRLDHRHGAEPKRGGLLQLVPPSRKARPHPRYPVTATHSLRTFYAAPG